MIFQYKAVDPGGMLISGSLEAASEAAATQLLTRQSLIPVQLQADIRPLAAAWKRPLRWRNTVDMSDLVTITQGLAALIKAGLTLDRALNVIASTSDQKSIRTLAATWELRIREGETFSNAISKDHKKLPSYFVTVVRAGELSGSLAESLERLSAFVERASRLRERLISSLIYPAMLAGMILVTITLVLTIVLPRFKALFADAHVVLPLPTRVVLTLGDAVTHYGLYVTAILIVIATLIFRRWRDPINGIALDRRLLTTRWSFGVIVKTESARFFRSIGTMGQSGVALPDAVDVALDMLRNRALREAGEQVAQGLRQGLNLSILLQKSTLFPAAAIQLARVGEETGRLNELLIESAETLDREAQNTIERLLNVMVPAITILMGAFVAGLIASVLVGILSLNDLAF